MNENNILNLRSGSFGRVCNLVNVGQVFIPTVRRIANAKVLNVFEDGSISVHWDSNWNLSGDFESELMQFNKNLVLDIEDKQNRNKFRKENGLVEVK